ncbi:MAG: M48 family metallopeptidase [Kiritimatiellia bacterium]
MKNRLLNLIFLLTLTGCATYSSFIDQSSKYLFSEDEEVRLGSQVFSETRASMSQQGVPRNANPAQVRKIQNMVNRIAAVSDNPHLPYEVDIYSTPVVNAMAAPGGKIIVFEGLWDPKNGLAKSDDEIAAVLAHEIAHVNCRHSAKAMTSNMLLGGSLAVASAVAKSRENNTAALALGGAFIAYEGLLVTHYSRRDEYEADRVGMMYMAKAGYDPRAAVRIWERAAAGGGNSGSPLDMLSTHPNDANRMQALRQQLPAAMEIYKKQR